VHLISKKDNKNKTVLVHRRTEIPGPPTSSLKKIVYETRGIREFALEIFADDQLTIAAANLKVAPGETYEMFLRAANFWLKEVGENDYFEIIDVAEQSKRGIDSDIEKAKVDFFTFWLWSSKVADRHGMLSPAAIASRFISASDHVHRLANNNQELVDAIHAFADAWHWLHFEGFGEHELAPIGLKSAQGRAVGPTAVHKQASIKKQIIHDVYAMFADDEANGSARTNAKKAAGKLLSSINRSLSELKLRSIAEKSLIDELRPHVKKRFPEK
jgi:hypothetical protein